MFKFESAQFAIGVLRSPGEHALGKWQHACSVGDGCAPRGVSSQVECQPITVAKLHVGSLCIALSAEMLSLKSTIVRPLQSLSLIHI